MVRSQPMPSRRLAEDLTPPENAAVLVIDDFHLTGTGGANALALLLEYRAPSLQLVVATRVDPQLRGPRIRANQQLVELRARTCPFQPKRPKRSSPGSAWGRAIRTWLRSTAAARAWPKRGRGARGRPRPGTDNTFGPRTAQRRRGTRTGEAAAEADIRRYGVRPAPLVEHGENPPPPHLHEARRHIQVLSHQTSHLAGPSVTA